jgi:hypothetical protein
MGQITIGVQPEVVVAVTPRHRWCGGFIDDQRRNPVPVLELAGDGKTARPGSDDNDVMSAPAVTEYKLHVDNTIADAGWFTSKWR